VYIRFFNGIYEPIDIYIDALPILTDFSYGSISGYIPISPKSVLRIYSHKDKKLLLTEPIHKTDAEFMTYAICQELSKIYTVVLEDDSPYMPGKTGALRFFSADGEKDLYDVDIATKRSNPTVIFEDVPPRVATPYRIIPSERYDLTIRSRKMAFPPIELKFEPERNTAYTLFMWKNLYSTSQEMKTKIVKDRIYSAFY
jgi:hypothetical protein